MEVFTLPAGTICKRNGIPFAVVKDTAIESTAANWPLIRDDFKPEASDASAGVHNEGLKTLYAKQAGAQAWNTKPKGY